MSLHKLCIKKQNQSTLIYILFHLREHLRTVVFIHCLQCDGLDWQKSHFSSSVGESHQILYQHNTVLRWWLTRKMSIYLTSYFAVFPNSQPSMKSHLFPLFVVLRVVFIPALMLCNVQPRSFLPVFFNHDMAYVIIMSLFAMTSGYFASLSMSYAPQ